MYIGRGRGITVGTVLEDVPDFRRTVSEDVADPNMFVTSLESETGAGCYQTVELGQTIAN